MPCIPALFRLKRLPPRAPVVVFGATRIELFGEPIIERLPAVVVEVAAERASVVYVSVRASVLAMWLCLTQYDRSLSLRRNLYLGYMSAILRLLRPRVVLGFYGATSPVFGTLANRLSGIIFISAFPGPLWWRQLDRVTPGPVHYLVPAAWDREKLLGAGVSSRQVEVVGSMYGSAFRRSSVQSGVDTPASYDICIISQIAGEDREVQETVERNLCRSVRRFACESAGLRLAVARRPQATEAGRARETGFFREHLDGLNYDLIENDGRFSTYETASRSRVTITHYSTVGFDLLWLGEKVLFFQEPASKFPVPGDVVFCTRRGGYDEFRNVLDRLLRMSSEEYLERTRENRRRYSGLAEEGNDGVDSVVGAVQQLLESRA